MDTAVGLVKAYLELCGYFVLAELPVRSVDGIRQSGQEGRDRYRDVTDLDILAVRFPHMHDVRQDRVARPLDVFLGVDPDLGGTDEAIDVVIGEVKEGEARLNPALLRAETVAFALRRVGCCPDRMVEAEAAAVVRDGERLLAMPGRAKCLVRLVAFAGQREVGEPGVRTISLAHCAGFITRRLIEADDVLAGAHFKDSVLGLLALQHKLSHSNRRR